MRVTTNKQEEEKNEMMKTMIAACLAAGLIACAGPISKTAKQDMAQAVDCGTAEGDLRVLESEKAHVGKEIANGVLSIAPPALVLGLVTRTEGDKIKVATGQYNKALDKKIAEIKQECGL
jgi:hypothetical protein